MTLSGRHTALEIRARKGSAEPLVMVTAYDFPTAQIVDGAGVDVILVGDTLSEVVLGNPDTLPMRIEQMAYHVAAVARAQPRALVVGDMPWLSYHLDPADAVRNAAELVRAGARAVKLEGGRTRTAAIRAIVDAEIPVMGHLGLTPQSIHAIGGYKVQARTTDAARRLLDEARAVQEAGCFAIVLECVPHQVAAMVTDRLDIPTIGIGSGPACDGQVLVFHDLVGYTVGGAHQPRYVRRYADIGSVARTAISEYAADVRARRFPTPEQSYSLTIETEHELGLSPAE